jgi:hypothetical protein
VRVLAMPHALDGSDALVTVRAGVFLGHASAVRF